MIKTGRLGKGFLFEWSVGLNDEFPLPRIRNDGKGELGLKRLVSPGMTHYWAKGGKGHWYVVSRQGDSARRVVVLGLDDEELMKTFELWLSKCAEKGNAKLVEAGQEHRLLSPDGLTLVENDPGKERPDTVFPIASRLGTWEMLVWNDRRAVVEFREEVLMTAGAVALGILMIGGVGFWMLRRSMKVVT